MNWEGEAPAEPAPVNWEGEAPAEPGPVAVPGPPAVRGALFRPVYEIVLGIAGGMVTVLFFAVWSRAFGGGNLGRIQGAAQMLTVLASALGPVVFEFCKKRYGSYTPLFYSLAPVCGVFALLACFTSLPASTAAGPGGQRTGAKD